MLELLVTRLTNGQIAARLYLAESTVKSRVASAFAKLGVRSRKEAATLLRDRRRAWQRSHCHHRGQVARNRSEHRRAPATDRGAFPTGGAVRSV